MGGQVLLRWNVYHLYRMPASGLMLESETIEDLRTAAFAVALEKVVRSYRQMGLA